MLEGLCHVNCPQRTDCQCSSTVMFWGIWRKTFGTNNLHNSNWVFHNDNGTAYSMLKTREFFIRTSTIVAPYPLNPLSLDLAPCDFFHFSKMKFKLKGRRLNSLKTYHKNLFSHRGGDPARITNGAWHADRTGLLGSVQIWQYNAMWPLTHEAATACFYYACMTIPRVAWSVLNRNNFRTF